MNRQVKFRLAFDARRHQSSGVERNHNRLVALDLILPRRDLAAPRRRRPRDVSQLIAAHVVAQ